MTQIQHRFADIYDKLNSQPHLQELIATPVLEQLDQEFDSVCYHMMQRPWQTLMISDITSVIDQIGWDIDANPGSFASYMIYVLLWNH